MNTAPHQTILFPTQRALLRKLPMALVLCLAGLIALAFDAPSAAQAVAAFALTCGLATIAVVLVRQIVPAKPRLALLAEGVYLRLSWDGEIVIPWSEVTAVDVVTTYQRSYAIIRDWSDILLSLYLNDLPLQQPNITALVVSQELCDTQVRPHIGWLPFPGWQPELIYLERGVQIALPHEPLWMSPRAMHEAVVTAWRAYDSPSAAGTAPASATTLPDTIRVSTKIMEGVKLGLPIIGIVVLIANLVGAWQTSKQRAVRHQHEQTAREEAKRKAEDRRRSDELDRVFAWPRERQ